MTGNQQEAADQPELLAESERRSGMPLWIAILALILAFVRFGYGYGSGDQDELIPSVLRLLDPSLFGQDWLVESVAGTINVRTFFLLLIAVPSVVIPIWLTTLLLWIAVAILLAYSVYAVAWEILLDRVGASLAVLLALVVTARFTIGGNAVMSSMLTPEGVAWPLALFGIALFLRGNEIYAGAALGVATWFHLLAGLHPTMLLGLAGVYAVATRGLAPGVVSRFGLAYVLTALPMLGPVAADQLAQDAIDPEGISPFYVHAYFRNPFHHLLSEVPPGQFARFGLTMMMGVVGGWYLSRRQGLHHRVPLVVAALAAVVLIGVGAILVERFEVGLAMKLQFQKMTLLLVLGATVLVAGAICHLLPAKARALAENAFRLRGAFAFVATITALALGLGAWSGELLADRAQPVRHQESQLYEVERWASIHTPVEALFAIPPSVSTFRTHARRSVYANYAAFVFTDSEMQTWFVRLSTVAPIEPPRDGFDAKQLLDSAFHGNSTDRWLSLGESEGISYVLVEAARAPDIRLDRVFGNEAWHLYAIPRGRDR